jgi:hypothetical protein
MTMEEKFSLRIETTMKSVHFYLDGVLLHTIPNELSKRRGYRYDGYNGYGHSDAYLRGNKVYVTLKFLGDDGKAKMLKTSYVVPRKKLISVTNALAEDTFQQVAEE